MISIDQKTQKLYFPNLFLNGSGIFYTKMVDHLVEIRGFFLLIKMISGFGGLFYGHMQNNVSILVLIHFI